MSPEFLVSDVNEDDPVAPRALWDADQRSLGGKVRRPFVTGWSAPQIFVSQEQQAQGRQAHGADGCQGG